MMHRAWSSVVEVPYCFSRSYLKFQGHTALKIVEFDPNWAFPDCTSSLNSPMAMKCCTKLETAKERCPIVFQGHPSNFKVTQDKTTPILTQIGRFRTIGWSQLSNPSDLPCFGAIASATSIKCHRALRYYCRALCKISQDKINFIQCRIKNKNISTWLLCDNQWATDKYGMDKWDCIKIMSFWRDTLYCDTLPGLYISGVPQGDGFSLGINITPINQVWYINRAEGWYQEMNIKSLAPERCGCNFKCVIFKPDSDSDSDNIYSTKIYTSTISGLHEFLRNINNTVVLIYK